MGTPKVQERSPAWLLLSVIVFATLSPIGLRPVSGLPVNWERLLTFASIALILALAYPRPLLLAAATIAVSAIALEAIQLLLPTRHARFVDLVVKLTGAAAPACSPAGLLRA